MQTKEWVAVAVALFVVGFFFIFGGSLISYFSHNNINLQVQNSQPQVGIQDEVIGGGDVAALGDRVTVNYVGTLSSGKVFDSSIARGEPFAFVLGAGQVIKGWDEGIAGMRVGGKRILTIPPSLGYGPNSYGPIPGNSTLVFEVELLKVEKQ